MSESLQVQYAIDLLSVANIRPTRRVRMGRTKRHREAAYYQLTAQSRRLNVTPVLPCTIVMTRIAPRKIKDEAENLPYAWKATKDGIADFLGVDDSDARISWVYKQETASKKELRLLPQQSIARICICWGAS